MSRIRPEGPGDEAAIRDLTRAAFAAAPHASGAEPAIVDALRAAGALALSLVAEEAGGICGHVAFSPVAIDGRDMGWLGLGPISVRPDLQRQGIGSALVRGGLARLAGGGAAGCVVLGEPAFYAHFGFAADPRLTYAGAPAAYFMARPLCGPVPRGAVAFHPAFGG